MNREILIPLTNEQIDYMLDLLNNELDMLNNENMSNSTNAAFAESLLCHLAAHEAHAGAVHTDDDAYWSAREAALNDEHIDAECAARSLGF